MIPGRDHARGCTKDCARPWSVEVRAEARGDEGGEGAPLGTTVEGRKTHDDARVGDGGVSASRAGRVRGEGTRPPSRLACVRARDTCATPGSSGDGAHRRDDARRVGKINASGGSPGSAKGAHSARRASGILYSALGKTTLTVPNRGRRGDDVDDDGSTRPPRSLSRASRSRRPLLRRRSSVRFVRSRLATLARRAVLGDASLRRRRAGRHALGGFFLHFFLPLHVQAR